MNPEIQLQRLPIITIDLDPVERNTNIDMVLKPTTMSSQTGDDPLEQIKQMDVIECGKEARQHFDFADGYRNLNHGMSCLPEAVLDILDCRD